MAEPLNLNAVVTDVGLAAASLATPYGPYIHITSFKLGDGYGYTPTRHDTGLNGSLVFESPVTSYHHIPPKTINVRCRIDPLHGPFEFGELALFLDSGEMFAKMVFPSLQLKTSSLMTNVASAYTFNCLIKLEQSIAIFDITTDCGPEMLVVERWSDVYPPAIPIFDGVPSMLVTELDKWGRSSLLQYSSPNTWTIGSTYNRYAESKIVSGNTTSVVLNGNGFSDSLDFITGVSNRDFVLEFPNSVFRSVSSVSQVGSNYRFNLNPAALPAAPQIGATVVVHYDPYVRISKEPGNRLSRRQDGLGVWDDPPAELAYQYVSTSLGNDNNEGHRNSPLKTLGEAARRISESEFANTGAFTILLRAGETFPFAGSLGCNILEILPYDDPKYGDQSYHNGDPIYNPIGLATDSTNAIIVFSTHATSAGQEPALLRANQTLFLKGIDYYQYIQNTSAGYVYVCLTGNNVTLWGCNAHIPDNCGNVAYSTGMLDLVHTNVNLGQNCTVMFNSGSARLLYNKTPGTVVPAKYGYPAFTVKGDNIKDVVNINNVGSGSSYAFDATTKSLFGISVNWDIFA